MANLQHLSEDPVPSLLFCKQPLEEDNYAVIRITWYLSGMICGISETSIKLWEADIIEEFVEILRNALQVGCDVSVVCIDDMEHLGLVEV